MDDEVDSAWVATKVNKVLTNRRYALNQLIDRGQMKPPEVTDQQWNMLVTRRSSSEAKLQSERMADVSKGKGSKRPRPAALREAAVVKLVSIFEVVGDILRRLWQMLSLLALLKCVPATL